MSYLPADYNAARRQFTTAAESVGAKVTSVSVPCHVSITPDLFVDMAYLNPRGSRDLLIITSGVHGVEGYAGSACMSWMLESERCRVPKVAILFIHALNPWGFANDSRGTEDNIDLNRNFVDFSRALPESASYSQFHDLLCANYHPGIRGVFNELRLLSMAVGKRKRRELQDGITSGQFSHPDGLFYVGNEVTINRKILETALEAYAQDAEVVRIIDIHTGLGKPGYGSLISGRPEEDEGYKLLNRYLNGQLTSMCSDQAVSSPLEGLMPAFVEAKLGAKCLAISLEFGVVNVLSTLNALRAENWLRRERVRNDLCAAEWAIRARMRKAFCLFNPHWERMILTRFAWTTDRLIDSIRSG